MGSFRTLFCFVLLYLNSLDAWGNQKQMRPKYRISVMCSYSYKCNYTTETLIISVWGHLKYKENFFALIVFYLQMTATVYLVQNSKWNKCSVSFEDRNLLEYGCLPSHFQAYHFEKTKFSRERQLLC